MAHPSEEEGKSVRANLANGGLGAFCFVEIAGSHTALQPFAQPFSTASRFLLLEPNQPGRKNRKRKCNQKQNTTPGAALRPSETSRLSSRVHDFSRPHRWDGVQSVYSHWNYNPGDILQL